MSAGLKNKSRICTAGAVSIQTGTDNNCVLVGPVHIYRFGVHQTVAKTTGTAGVFTLESVAGVTETTLATATQPDAIAVNVVTYKEFNPPLVVAEGAWFKVETTTNANAGSGVMFVEYVEDPLTKSTLDGLVAMT